MTYPASVYEVPAGPPHVTPPARPVPAPVFYTVAEVAAWLHVSKAIVYKLFHAGELPGAIRIRQQIRIPERALEQFASDQ